MNGFFFYILFGLAVSGIIYGIADPFDKYPETLAQHYVSEFGSFTGFFSFQDAYAEPFRGPDYIIEQLDGDTYKKTIGLKPFVYNNETDSFVPYIHRDGVTFTAHGTVTLDSDCTFNFYESDFINENSTALFQDKILVKAADISNPETWEPLDLINQASCNKSWGASFEQFSTDKLRTDIGLMEYKYIINDGSWKTQLEATNLSNDDTKMFGFDQIIDLNTDIITFGNREINIDNFDGAVFERDWLERNDARVMVFEGFYFDVDIAWDYLNSVQVIDTGIGSSRIIFDYRTDDVLMPHETLILDPEFGNIDSSDTHQGLSDAVASASCDAPYVINSPTNGDIVIRSSASADTCAVQSASFDTASIPSNADITTLNFVFDVDSVTSPRNCDFVQLLTDPDTQTGSQFWTSATTGTDYVSNDATCTTTANDKTVSLGSTAITDLINSITDDQLFTVGITMTPVSRDGTTHSITMSDFRLDITYNLPPDPPKQFSGSVNPTTGVSTSWSAGETNGDTHNDFTVQRLNLDGVTWDDLTTTTSTSYLDNQPQQNDTASYRIWDNGDLGRGCSAFLMNSTIIANLTSHFPFCYTTNDNGIQDNDGTVTGNELYDNSTGIISFDFDGNSYVTLPNESDYDFERTDKFSISFWIKTSSVQFDMILGKNTGLNSVGIHLFNNISGQMQFELVNTLDTNHLRVISSVINDGQWHHVTVTYDGSSSASGVQFYLDSVADAGQTTSLNTLSSSILNNNSFSMGASSNGNAILTGQLDEVMIIDRELDSNEVAQIYGEYIDTSTLAMKPNAVTDLVATTPPNLSTVNLAWTEPFVFGGTDGYMINFTSPFGDPLTIRTNNTESTDTSTAILGLQIGVDYSFRVSPWNDFGTNGSGNIVNATTETSYEIGNLTSPDVTNMDDFSIFYERNDINSTALFLNVTYPNTYTLECNMYYQFARTNNTYSGLSSTAVDSDNVESSFLFINATGDIVNVKCYDTVTGDEAKYVLTITQFPFLDQIDNMRNGTYGTYFEVGAIDGITLMVVFLAMIGFNRTTPIAGIVFLAITILALSFFDIITYPVIMYPALALLMVWGFMATRKDD